MLYVRYVHLTKARPIARRAQSLLCNRRTNNCVNTFSRNEYAHDNRVTAGVGVFYSICTERVIRKTTGTTQLLESHPVKRRLGGCYEMAASLRVVSCQLRVEFCTGGCEDRP
jgi:hypothetical protein